MRALVAGFLQKLGGSLVPCVMRLHAELVLLPTFNHQLVVILLGIALDACPSSFEKRF